MDVLLFCPLAPAAALIMTKKCGAGQAQYYAEGALKMIYTKGSCPNLQRCPLKHLFIVGTSIAFSFPPASKSSRSGRDQPPIFAARVTEPP